MKGWEWERKGRNENGRNGEERGAGERERERTQLVGLHLMFNVSHFLLRWTPLQLIVGLTRSRGLQQSTSVS